MTQAAAASDDRGDEASALAKTRWSDLSPRSRRLIVVAGGVEAILKVAGVVDLVRRPAEQVRGSKERWAAVIVVACPAGIVPLAYFRFDRRR